MAKAAIIQLRLLLSIIALSMACCATAQNGLVFEFSELEQALKAAKEADKAVFVFISSPDDGSSKMMESMVFEADEMTEIFSDTFITTRILLKDWNVSTYSDRYDLHNAPAYLFLTWDGTVLEKQVGFINIPEWSTLVRRPASKKYWRSQIMSRVRSGDTDTSSLYHLIKLSENKDEVRPLVPLYLASKEDWLDPAAQEIIFTYPGKWTSETFRFMSRHKEAFAKNFGDQIELYIDSVAERALSVTDSLPLIDSIFAYAYPEDANKRSLEYRLSIYEKYGEDSLYAGNAVKYYQRYENERSEGLMNDIDLMIKYAQVVHYPILDHWIDLALKRDRSPQNLLRRARLRRKMGRLEEAIEDARMAYKATVKADGNSYPIKEYIKELKDDWKESRRAQ